jgi:hypothetical protein
LLLSEKVLARHRDQHAIDGHTVAQRCAPQHPFDPAPHAHREQVGRAVPDGHEGLYPFDARRGFEKHRGGLAQLRGRNTPQAAGKQDVGSDHDGRVHFEKDHSAWCAVEPYAIGVIGQ